MGQLQVTASVLPSYRRSGDSGTRFSMRLVPKNLHYFKSVISPAQLDSKRYSYTRWLNNQALRPNSLPMYNDHPNNFHDVSSLPLDELFVPGLLHSSGQLMASSSPHRPPNRGGGFAQISAGGLAPWSGEREGVRLVKSSCTDFGRIRRSGTARLVAVSGSAPVSGSTSRAHAKAKIAMIAPVRNG